MLDNDRVSSVPEKGSNSIFVKYLIKSGISGVIEDGQFGQNYYHQKTMVFFEGT